MLSPSLGTHLHSLQIFKAINTVLLKYPYPVHLQTFYLCFHMIVAESHDFDRDHQVYNAKKIYLSSSLHKMFVSPEVLNYSTHNP